MDIINKYKPKSFKNFIGNKNIIDTLLKISKQKNIPNLLLSGNSGSGKTLIRNIFIKSLNFNDDNILYVNLNEDLKKNNIKNSKLFNFLKKPVKNLIIIDNYEEIPLEQQYILRSFIKNYNFHSTFLIFLNNTSNIIEQLSNYFLIFKLKLNTKKDFLKYIHHIVENEKLDINDDIINYIADISNNFREVINNFVIVLNYYFSKKEITKNDLNYLLNLSDKKYANDIFKLCDKKNIRNIILLVDELLNDGYSINDLINILTINIKNTKCISYKKKIKYIELISFSQIKMINNLNTYTQFLSLISKMCKV